MNANGASLKDNHFLKLVNEFKAPLFSVLLMVSGSAFYTTFTSLLLQMQGYQRSEIGIVQSAFFFGLLIGGFQMERMIKRFGHVQSLAVFGSLATAVTLLQALNNTFIAWILFRFIHGISLAALYIIIESWMLDHSSLKNRGVVLSLYMMSLYMAQAWSQQLLKFMQFYSMTPFIVSAIFTALSVIPVSLSTKKLETPNVEEQMSIIKLFRLSPFGVSGCIVSGLFLSVIYTFFPLYAVEHEIPSENLMTITIAGGFFLQWPIGKLSDLFERRKMLFILILITFALCLTIVFLPTISNTGFLALAFLIGGLSFCLYPISITQVCDHIDNHLITRVTGLLLVLYGIGTVIGPILSSLIISMFGISMVFAYLALLMLMLGAVGFYSISYRPVIPQEDQMEFQPLTPITPVAYEMDPRTED